MVGSAAQSDDASAMRSTVFIAVPEGASTFWSWCSSMTSAVSKNGAAISAKRIISTAPMAKFGATMQFDGEALADVGEVVLGEPAGPDHGVDAVGGAHATFCERRRPA